MSLSKKELKELINNNSTTWRRVDTGPYKDLSPGYFPTVEDCDKRLSRSEDIDNTFFGYSCREEYVDTYVRDIFLSELRKKKGIKSKPLGIVVEGKTVSEVSNKISSASKKLARLETSMGTPKHRLIVGKSAKGDKNQVLSKLWVTPSIQWFTHPVLIYAYLGYLRSLVTNIGLTAKEKRFLRRLKKIGGPNKMFDPKKRYKSWVNIQGGSGSVNLEYLIETKDRSELEYIGGIRRSALKNILGAKTR